MGDSLDRGHVATFSLWDDIDVHMMWLDSCYPTDESCSKPGVRRGMCPGGDESSPQLVRQKHPTSYVTFANVAFGEIGTTQSVYPGKSPTTPTTPDTTSSTSSAAATLVASYRPPQPPVEVEVHALVRGNSVEDRISMAPHVAPVATLAPSRISGILNASDVVGVRQRDLWPWGLDELVRHGEQVPGIQAVFLYSIAKIIKILKAALMKLSLEHKLQLPFVMQVFLVQQRCEDICRPTRVLYSTVSCRTLCFAFLNFALCEPLRR